MAQAAQPAQPTEFVISVSLSDQIIDYLKRQPYEDAAPLIEGLRGSYSMHAAKILDAESKKAEAEAAIGKKPQDHQPPKKD